jgi:hypothetical protein
MILRRIEIRNFRKLVEPIVIEGIGDGLTVIAGDNEEGKSTILQALRHALFDRYKLTGKQADALVPFGLSVGPEICLDFEFANEPFSLRKVFCRNAAAELRTPRGTISGPEVEDRLREMLRFDRPGSGASKAEEHQGIMGLFWVAQGTAFTGTAVSDQNRLTLLQTLEGEVGTVLGGERGRVLLAKIEQKYHQFYTNTGRLKAEQNKTVQLVEDLKGKVEDLKSRLKEYDAKVDELERVRARLNRYRIEDSLATAEKTLDDAETKQKKSEEFKLAVEKAKRDEVLAEARRNTPIAKWTERLREIENDREAAEKATTAGAGLNEISGGLAGIEKQATIARSTYMATQESFRRADAVYRSAFLREDRRRLRHNLEALVGRLGLAKAAREGEQRARGLAAAITVDTKSVKHLQKLERDAADASAMLKACATLVEFAVADSIPIRINGEEIHSPESRALTEKTTIDLAGRGSITVTPGSSELQTRTAAFEKASRRLEAALADAGFVDSDAAEARLVERTRLEDEAGTKAKFVAVHAPEGLEELASAVAEATAAAEQFAGEEGAREADSAGALDPELPVPAAEAMRHAAEADLNKARIAHEKWQEQTFAAREAIAKAEAKRDEAVRTADRISQRMAAARLAISDAALQKAVAEATEALAEAQATLEAVNRILANANPEEIELRLEAARDAITRVREDIEAQKLRAIELDIELRTMGQVGLGEDLQQAEGDLGRAVAIADKVARDAETIKFLYETLVQAERSAKELFLSPVRERIRPYLGLLLPEADIVIDEENLGVTHLRRNGHDEPFDALSIGTREQIVVLTRLGFADLLRERNQLAPVILDDALVYSDPRRFEQMQLILRKAAKRLQIIVLTCREDDYRGMGAPIIRLEDCRIAAATAAE